MASIFRWLASIHSQANSAANSFHCKLLGMFEVPQHIYIDGSAGVDFICVYATSFLPVETFPPVPPGFGFEPNPRRTTGANF